jgi:Flp pilus assembly protein TadD
MYCCKTKGANMQKDSSFDRLIAQGLEASRNNQTEQAVALFDQASRESPASGIPHFLIGSEHAAAGDVEAAEQAFAQAVLLSPDFGLARYQLGLLQFSTARAAMALVTWQPLLALPPADPLLHFVRGFQALARDGFAEALHHYREGLACHDINQGLAADIQRLVDAVEHLPAPPEEPATREAPEPAAHVLLSAYARRLH